MRIHVNPPNQLRDDSRIRMRTPISRRRFLAAAGSMALGPALLTTGSAHAQSQLFLILLTLAGGIVADCAKQLVEKFFMDEITPTLTVFEKWYETRISGQHQQVVTAAHNQLAGAGELHQSYRDERVRA